MTSPPPQAAGSVPPCKEGQVRVESVGGQGAGSTFLGSVEYVLVGSSPCSLTGYGGLDVHTSHGVRHATRTTGLPLDQSAGEPTQAMPVVLTAASESVVPFSWDEGDHTAPCPSISQIVLTAPGLHESATEPYTALGLTTSLCGPPEIGFAVSPTARGR